MSMALFRFSRFLLLVLAGAPCGAQLIVNPAQNLTHRVQIQPVIVRTTGGTVAEFMAYAYAMEVMAATSQLPDAREGMRAFLEKRKPQWSTGRP